MISYYLKIRNTIILLFFLFIANNIFALTKDTLRIGAGLKHPPFHYVNEEGDLVGFTVDLIKEVMHRLEQPYTLKAKKWELIQADYKSGQIDLLLDAEPFTSIDSISLYSYTISYNKLTVFTLKDSGIKTLEDLEDLPVGIWRSAVESVDFSKYVLLNRPFNFYLKFESLVSSLKNKYNAAIICPYNTFFFYEKQFGLKDQISVVTQLQDLSSNVLAVHKKDNLLMHRINEVLFELKSEGIFDQLEKRWLLPFKQEKGGVSYWTLLVLFFVIILFITTYPRLLKLLRISRKERINEAKFFEHVIRNINYPIYVKDVEKNNECIFWNKAAQENFGQAKGQNIDVVLGAKQAEQVEAIDKKLYETGKTYVGYEQIVTLRGQRHDTQVIKTIVTEGKRKYLLVVRGITTDLVKARKKAENEGRLMSSFLANMSHEIRTPLNAIVGFSELLTEITDSLEKKEYINIIHNNTQLMLKLVGDIINLSTYDSGNMDIASEWIDMNLFLEDLRTTYERELKEVKKEKKIRFILDQPYAVFRIKSDRNLWMQIATNLLNNAVKYTYSGYIRLGCVFHEGQLILYVQDTGIGIAKENITKVFSRYTRFDRVARGHGLGMAICEAIMKSVDGSMHVISKKAEGSIFLAKASFESDVVKKENYDWTPINQLFKQIQEGKIDNEK